MVVMMIMLAVTAMDMDSMDTTMVTAIASGVMAMTKDMDLWAKMRNGWEIQLEHVAMIPETTGLVFPRRNSISDVLVFAQNKEYLADVPVTPGLDRQR